MLEQLLEIIRTEVTRRRCAPAFDIELPDVEPVPEDAVPEVVPLVLPVVPLVVPDEPVEPLP